MTVAMLEDSENVGNRVLSVLGAGRVASGLRLCRTMSVERMFVSKKIGLP